MSPSAFGNNLDSKLSVLSRVRSAIPKGFVDAYVMFQLDTHRGLTTRSAGPAALTGLPSSHDAQQKNRGNPAAFDQVIGSVDVRARLRDNY